MPDSPRDDRARAGIRPSLIAYAVAFALPVGHPSFPGAEAFAASFMQGVSGDPYFLVIWLANPLLWLAVGLGRRQRTGWAAATGVVATLAALMALRMVGDDLYVLSPLPWRAVAIRSGLWAWIGGIAGFTLTTTRLWLGEREGRPVRLEIAWLMAAVALAAIVIQVWRWAEPPRHPPIRCERGRGSAPPWITLLPADREGAHHAGIHQAYKPRSDNTSARLGSGGEMG